MGLWLRLWPQVMSARLGVAVRAPRPHGGAAACVPGGGAWAAILIYFGEFYLFILAGIFGYFGWNICLFWLDL